MSTHIAIIGAGCAGLSLAATLANREDLQLSLYGPADDRPDHIWGFWQHDEVSTAGQLAHGRWHKWQIITDAHCITHHSAHHPYLALSARNWLSHCQDKLSGLPHHKARLPLDAALPDADIVFDSRPRPYPDAIMLQHFLGWEIQTEQPVFCPDTAILMDFRTSQAHGVHFIYLLPFSSTEALVESTYFTAATLDEAIYEADIQTYLQDQFELQTYTITRREAGVIPMADIAAPTPRQPNHIFIGGAGGAIRPSSGYAFAFIQSQVNTLAATAPACRPAPPHNQIDRWMDRVFLRVLESQPHLAPSLFAMMASRLSGDEFARFMSGSGGIAARLNMIMAMPKWPFLWAALQCLFTAEARR